MPSAPPVLWFGRRATFACMAAAFFTSCAFAVSRVRADDSPAAPAAESEDVDDVAAKAEEAEEAAGGLVPNWRAKFDALYRLVDGEDAKLIEPPFSPERIAMQREHGNDDESGQYALTWRNGRTDVESWSFSSGTGSVASGLEKAGIDRVDVEGPSDLLELPARGDWIVREGADRAALFNAVRRELIRATNGAVRIERARRVKEVIVARGRFEFKSLNLRGRSKDAVQLFADTKDPADSREFGGGSSSVAGLLRHVQGRVGQKILDETEPYDGDVSWQDHRSSQHAKAGTRLCDELLRNVAAQTSLAFRVERREVDVWVVEADPGEAGGL